MSDELYPTCPRCRGNRYVHVSTPTMGGFGPTRDEEFPCPLCHEVGTIHRDVAADYQRQQAERLAEYDD
jgi:hypothetical protein